jgi:hypothetical protein
LAGRAVAVLGHRHAAGGDHEADGGRDVERVVPVAARAAHVDGVGRGFDGDHPLAHGARRARDLARGFAPVGQGDEEGSGVFIGHLAIEDCAKGGERSLLVERGCRDGGQRAHAGSWP